MKKFCSIFVLSLIHAALFLAGWELFMEGYISFFLYYVVIFPVLSAVTFLILGNIFYRRFHTNRILMWFCMNLLGGAVGWAGIFMITPELLSSPVSIMVVLFLLLSGFGSVWAVVGVIWLVLRLIRRQGEKHDRRIVEQAIVQDKKLAYSSKSPNPAREGNPGKFKDMLKTAGICLCGLSVLMIGYSVYYTYKERPADAYEDKGIYTFKAYNVYPTQVKNTTSRYNRRQTTRTVYVVEYKTTTASGYRWREDAPSKYAGNQWIKEGKTVQRRVLSIKDTNTYITVDSKYTAETYVKHNKSKYTIILLISGLYLIGYMAVWLHRREKQRLEE